MKVNLKLPRFGMNMEEGTIVTWKKTVGDAFEAGEILYEVETEKVTSEVEAPCAGTLVEIVAAVEAIVPVGGVVCRIETRGP